MSLDYIPNKTLTQKSYKYKGKMFIYEHFFFLDLEYGRAKQNAFTRGSFINYVERYYIQLFLFSVV